jgi:hypothetical protein
MAKRIALHLCPYLLRPPPTTISRLLRPAWQKHHSSQKTYGLLFHLCPSRTWVDLASVRSLLALVPMFLERVVGTCDEAWMLAVPYAAQVTKCDEVSVEGMVTDNEEAVQLIARRCLRCGTLNLALFH